MGEKTDVWQGTLALMVLRTLETLGPLHGYGVLLRIQQMTDSVQLIEALGGGWDSTTLPTMPTMITKTAPTANTVAQ